MTRKVRETAGITWYAGFCRKYGIGANEQEACWAEMLEYFNPEVQREDASSISALLHKLGDVFADMEPSADVEDIATLIAKHGDGISPTLRSTQHAVRKFIKENDLLEYVPASRERYVRRLTDGRKRNGNGSLDASVAGE